MTLLEKWNQCLSGTLMTCISGVLLLVSLTLSFSEISLPLDPAWGAVIISGLPLLYLAVWRIIYNEGISKISSALLISIGMFAALGIGDLFAAGEVAFIMAIGAILEEKTTERAKKGLKKLIELAPEQGRLLKDGQETMIPASQIQVDDILRILPGERIPADGIIIRGTTAVDQSILTGESLPLDKETGSEVFCGTINCFGSIDIRTTKIGENSSLKKMIQLVQEAEKQQAPIQRIADRWASWLVPAALCIAAAGYIGTGDLVVGVTILVVFCPCALVLATPTAIMAAIGQAAKHGVVIKSGEALEKMGKVDTIAFDKTGTLTFGRPEVSNVIAFLPGWDDKKLLAFSAAAEAHSEHPLGRAVVTYARKQEVPALNVEEFQMNPGKGISAKIEGREILCGNEKYLLEKGISIPPEAESTLKELRSQGKASIVSSWEGKFAGIIALSDVLRPNARQTINHLSQMGVRTVLLTGDNPQTGSYFAQKAGIQEVHAGLLPEEKVEWIHKFQKSGHSICMIGDGVNDAPALKTAEVGTAMGHMGSDIAVDAADFALMNDDISRIPYLKRLANATVKTIQVSISLSLFINLTAIILSLKGMLNPTTGALVHNAGSCFVVLIAALLYDRKFD